MHKSSMIINNQMLYGMILVPLMQEAGTTEGIGAWKLIWSMSVSALLVNQY
jgi:hypothetical protein